MREASAAADREVTDGYERQAVITAAAYILGQAGLWRESDALLKANLAKSHSPYYLMSQLGSNARKLGRSDEALRWYEEAFARSEGPATRLQWGAQYVSALVELAPHDEARLERAVARMIDEAALDAAPSTAAALARWRAWTSNWRSGTATAGTTPWSGACGPSCSRCAAASTASPPHARPATAPSSRRARAAPDRENRAAAAADRRFYLSRPSAFIAACTPGRAAMRAMKACTFDRSAMSTPTRGAQLVTVNR